MAADVRLGTVAESATQDLNDPRMYDVVLPLEEIPMRDPDRWLQSFDEAVNRQAGVDFSVERLAPSTIKIHVRCYKEQFNQHLGVLKHLVALANQNYGDPEADERRRRDEAQDRAASKAEGEREVLDHVNGLL
jgi:hypothetical protein